MIRTDNHILKIGMLILCHSKDRLIEVSMKGLDTAFHKGFFDFYDSFGKKAICKKMSIY